MRNKLLSLCLVLTPPTLAIAGEQGPCSSAAYHAFDFWLGDWQVHTPNGQLAGTNRITVDEGGCLLIEHWRGSRGATGQSYNFYDPGNDQWHQLWVSRDAIIRYAGGLTESGSMRLEGEITYQADGRRARFSGEWIPEDAGTVLQVLKEWDAETGQWQDWFTGRYSRP